MTTNPDKSSLRAELRRRRRALKAANPDAAAQAAARLPLESLPPFKVFSGYMPQASEIDPAPVMAKLLKTGAAIALPSALSWEEPLEFRLWDGRAPLEPDALGIAAPPPEALPVVPDLVVAPLLAFDRRGARLGQGAGHYDRTLKNLRRFKPVFVLGLAYAGQELDEVPMEPHDEPLNAILTETEFISVAREV